MKVIFRFGVILGMTLSTQAFATEVFNQSGRAKIGSDVGYVASANDEAIFQISVSNLTLDLGEHVLSLKSTDTHTGIDGIVIDAGLSNVTIKNGKIKDISGIGILVGDNCSNINIDNVIIESADETGIYFNGSAGINGGSVTNCVVMNCAGYDGNPAYGVRLSNCDNMSVMHVELMGNHAGGVNSGYGLALEACTSCRIGHCRAQGNGGLTLGAGFCAENGSGNIFHDCLSIANTAITFATGFIIKGTEEHSCIANCDSRLNDGGAGSGYGILLDGAQHCDIDGNSLVGNQGTTAGVGLQENAGTTNNFMTRNRAFDNETANYGGVPANSIQTATVSTLNTIGDISVSNLDIS